jgi:hypothetical protein
MKNGGHPDQFIWIRSKNDKANSIERLLDPLIMVQVGDMAKNKALVEVTNDAHARLKRAVESLAK